MDPLDLLNLTPLMQRTAGRTDLNVALIDGPVDIDHPDLIIVGHKGGQRGGEYYEKWKDKG